ncbi:MAG TPA: ATP-binding protein [Candidatus Angelobacter sp.]|nr:ATP-binding protein [Candidatus Angelobacter sp.]
MKTLLVLAKESGLAAAARAVLDPERYRVVGQSEAWEAEPLLRQGTIDGCIIDADLTNIRPLRAIEELRRAMPNCPIIVYAAATQWEWEEEAYLLGVEHVLSKPIRARLLNTVLDKIWRNEGTSTEFLTALAPAAEPRALESIRGPVRTLEVLRDFSGILTHSLCSEALLKQFLLLLREIIGVNRAVIFLRRPMGVFSVVRGSQEDRRLRSVCALGLPPGLLEHFELSLEAGIGGYVHRKGRILQSNSEGARNDREIQKEFELLGGQVAIPILDRESLVGVAVFDGRLTGEPFVNEELALIFHLLEELGLAIKNSWLYDQLLANHEMMADILNQSGSGCLVVARELTILHANQAARDYFGRPARRGAAIEFGDLPQSIGSRVFESLQSGEAVPPFKYRFQGDLDTTYRVMITPFKRKNSITVNAVLLMIEDFTQSERSQQLEIEASNLRLVKTIAEHLAHEIGNSLVPLSTHQQLLPKNYDDPEFRASLGSSMGDAVQRISRLSNQMLFLARDKVVRSEAVPVAKLIEDAFLEAQKYASPKPANLVYDSGGQAPMVAGDRAGLKQALSEVMLNALQANPPNSPVHVRTGMDSDASGRWVRIEVRDAGPGFTEEAVTRAAEPFFSTRNVGLGLGLAVTRKIIETHHGRVEIAPKDADKSGMVRISLPQA